MHPTLWKTKEVSSQIGMPHYRSIVAKPGWHTMNAIPAQHGASAVEIALDSAASAVAVGLLSAASAA